MVKVLQGESSTRLKKMIVQVSLRGTVSRARCSVYLGQPQCGMKQDGDAKSLQKIGLLLAIFQLLHTDLTSRKEAATSDYTEKRCVYPDVLCSS